jgi:hypothetical protein
VDLWQWFATSVPAGAVINGLGLGALAALFATDRILTKGQHERRVADIVRGHELILVEKDKALAEMRDSRDYYRQARVEEKERADVTTSKLAEVVAENTKTTLKIAESIQEARG